jgi:hypothetical protein
VKFASFHDDGLSEESVSDTHRMIPFDYAFRYELTGTPDNVINKTVTVSIEATFIAVSIGYGVIPKVEKVDFGPSPIGPAVRVTPFGLSGISFGELIAGLGNALKEGFLGGQTAAVLRNGIKLNPQFAERALLAGGKAPLDQKTMNQLFQAVAAPPKEIQFLYAIFDEGSGREFQSEPILNTAGLGISDGDRPFRYFSRPIRFDRRSTIRMQVTEVSEFEGDLHVSLQGYKMLGEEGTPTGRVRRRV